MQIHIKKLRARPVIGVYEWEKQTRQDIFCNIWIDYDGSKAAKSDNVEDTLNYCTLVETLVEKIEETQFELIEKLVDYILDIIMEEPLADKAKIEVIKPAPLRKYAEYVSVKGERSRK